MQTQLKETLANKSNQSLKEKVEQLSKNEVPQATTRIVNVWVQNSCGCGGGYNKYHGEVPIDSPYHDNQHLSDFPYDMENIEDGWV